MADFLQLDIILNIFSRLSVKSLACCGCVCKSWSESVADPHLQTIHVKEEPTPLIFQRFPSTYPNIHCMASFLRVIHGSTAVKTDPVMEFLTKDTCFNFRKNRLFLSSCNGLNLVCLSHDENHGTTLGVIDPLRKECYELPTIEIWRGESVFLRSPNSSGIGFDDSTNTFKVVSVFQRDPVRRNLCTMVLVLGTSSWREVAEVPTYPITGEGVFANGSLHWLVSHSLSPNEGRKIMRFDVKKEEFEMIDPPEQNEQGWINDELVDLNGEVGYVYNNIEEISMEVWILKKKEWMIQCRIEKPTCCDETIKVSGCWNNEGDILTTLDHGRRLLVYRMKSGEVHEIDHPEDDEGREADVQMHRNSLCSIQSIIR